MGELVLPIDKGRKSSGNPLTFPPGFLERAENGIYLPDDPDMIHKIPGRATSLALPAAATAANTKGIVFVGYKTGDDKVLLLANSRLYQATAGTILGTWASVDDDGDWTSHFPMTGDFLKSIPDGQRRHVIWDGATGKVDDRALLRDEDGNWRRLSLYKSNPVTIAELTTAATIIRPNAVASPAPTTTSEGTVTGNFSTPANAWDDDQATFSWANANTPAVIADDFEFAAASLSKDSKMFITIGTSSLPPADGGRSEGGGSPSPIDTGDEPIDAYLTIQISTAASPAFVNIFSQNVPLSKQTLQVDLANGQAMGDVLVRVIFKYGTGTAVAQGYVYEIWVQGDDEGAPAGGNTPTNLAVFQYTTTEVFTIKLTNGKTSVVESAPATLTSIIAGASTTGFVLTLPATANPDGGTATKSAAQKRLHTRNIYRSVKDGAYPNLGRLATSIDITATTFVDDFTIDEDTLGSPGLAMVYIDGAPYPLAGPAPAFHDAALFEGSIVAIPAGNRFVITWSAKGFPEYYPFPHQFPFQSRGREDEGMGIVAIGDSLIIFLRGRVLRVRNLPQATAPNFYIEDLDIDILSPSEGLAGSPRAYTLFHSQKGHGVVAWVSDNGIWMTDGTLLSERGLGIVKLTSHQNWAGDVDTSRLAETTLTYDPILQTVVFDFYDPAGNLQTWYFHVSPSHWVSTGQDQSVPKVSGPHTLTALSRAVGEISGTWLHWSLNTTSLKVLLERSGITDDGSDILTHIGNEWIYPVGPRQEFTVYEGNLYHTDWGPGETCDLDLLIRYDETGVIQTHPQHGLPLRGKATVRLGYVNGSGQSLRFELRHTGKTTADRTTLRAWGPLVLEMEKVDEVR